MPVRHTFTSSKPPATDPTQVGSVQWNANHSVSISNVDVDSDAGIEESKLSLNYPTHPALTLGTANGLSLVGQALSLQLSTDSDTGALSSTDWNTFNGKQSALTFPLAASLGGTGISNGASSTLTLPNAATTITTGGTIALGGFTLTVPATGTAALLGTANVFTANQSIIPAFANPLTTTFTIQSKFNGSDARDKLELIADNSGAGTGTVKWTGQNSSAALRLQVTDNTNTSIYSFAIGNIAWSINNFRTYKSSGSVVTHSLGLNVSVDRFIRGYDTSGSELAYFDWDTATKLQFRIGGTSRAHQLLSGLWSIFPEDAVTNAVTNVLTLQHDSSGTPAAGFGVGLPFYAETATAGTAQPQGLISTSWIDPTNAIRKAKMSLSAYDTVARLGIEIEASGSAAMLGFFGAATVVQQANTTDLGVVLSNLGLRASGTAYPITTSGAVTLGSLTAGRVTFAGTGGLLSDDADMTFATDTLTVTKIIGSTSIKVGTAAGYISSDGSAGATGTFTTADLKTVTVKDGIVVSIV